MNLLATLLDTLAAWLDRVLGRAPEWVPIPIPVEQPRRRR
jgi:hypothetical protein